MKRVHVLLTALGAAIVLYAYSRTQSGGEFFSNLVGGGVDKIKKLIVGEEGYAAVIYQDAGAGHAWTGGYGHKILSTDVVRGQHLHPYGPLRELTEAEWSAIFKSDTAVATHAVDDSVKILVTSNQRAALISLVFNIGVSAFKSSALLRLLNAGDFQGAADQFGVWVNDNHVRQQFLVDRRERERTLFLA